MRRHAHPPAQQDPQPCDTRVRDWRIGAAELRATAAAVADAEAEAGLLRAAEAYERMAAELERRLNQVENIIR
jgi:hypothetical protein